jgi:aspartate/tyrosine/aromatic aminotransferase
MTTGTVNSFQLVNKFHGWRKINNIPVRSLSKNISMYGNSIGMLTSQRTSLKMIKKIF